MPPSVAILLAAVRHAPRRHRLPPLPTDGEAARASGAEAAVAYALEALRRESPQGPPVPTGTEDLFRASLDALVRAALSPQGGDVAFQALVLEAGDATVRDYRRLAAGSASDRRAVRAAVDAIAHPGKLRDRPAGPLTERLAALHRVSSDGVPDQLRRALDAVPAEPTEGEPGIAEALASLRSHPALARLERMRLLSSSDSVRRYLSLLERRASDASVPEHEAQHPARRGQLAEMQTMQAFTRIAALLNDRPGTTGRFRAMRGLRTPRALPLPAQAKGEWDALLLRELPGAGAAEIVLLAEVKAAPAAAADDLPSLLRGLRGLAGAKPGALYTFTGPDDEVRILGASLRELRPDGLALPAHVVYCCPAAGAARPRLLSAAGKARLLAHPASLLHAGRLLRGEDAGPEQLAPVWQDLHRSRALRRVLEQYETARLACEALLHPDDLADEVDRRLSLPTDE